jgi:hypothetical protein
VRSVRFHIHAPIPPPRLWVASLDADSPPGFIRLIGATIGPRAQRNASAGTDLVPSAGLDDALRSQLERLLLAFERLNAAARDELIRVAEQLGGIA